MEEIRLKKCKFSGCVIRMDMDRRVWDTMGRTREKVGTKWVVKLTNDWMGWGSKWEARRARK